MGMFGRDTRDYEGFRNKIYIDSEGHPTIGYGHKITQDEMKRGLYGHGISKELADKIYIQDRKRISDRLFNKYPQYKNYPEEVKTALIDTSFNMGESFLDKFKNMKKALDNKNYPEAATQLLDSRYANQVGQRAKDNAMKIASAYSPGSVVSTQLPPSKKQVILRDITPMYQTLNSGLGGNSLTQYVENIKNKNI